MAEQFPKPEEKKENHKTKTSGIKENLTTKERAEEKRKWQEDPNWWREQK